MPNTNHSDLLGQVVSEVYACANGFFSNIQASLDMEETAVVLQGDARDSYARHLATSAAMRVIHEKKAALTVQNDIISPRRR